MENIIKQNGKDVNNVILQVYDLIKAKAILFLGKLKAKNYKNLCFRVFKLQLTIINRNACYLYSQ